MRYIFGLIILIIALFIYERNANSEKYDPKNDFQIHVLENYKFKANIKYLKDYSGKHSSRYVYTEYGKLKIDAPVSKYGWWSPDKKLFELLESKLQLNPNLTCTFHVDNDWWYDSDCY